MNKPISQKQAARYRRDLKLAERRIRMLEAKLSSASLGGTWFATISVGESTQKMLWVAERLGFRATAELSGDCVKLYAVTKA